MTPPAPEPASTLRVMHVLARDAAAGTELMTAVLAERSAAHRVSATVVTLDTPGVIARRLAASGIASWSLGPAGPLRSLLRLARLVRETRPDVVCGYGFRTGLATRVVAQTLRPRPAVVTGVRGLYVTEIESLDSVRGRLVMAIERLTSRFVDAYVVNSRGAIEVLAAHGIPGARMHLVPNGLDAADWPAVDPASRAAAVLPVVVCVGRFAAVKRQADLVEAAALLRNRGVAARFVFAGDGPLRSAVAARATTLGLADRVDFLGSIDRSELHALLGEADIACLVSSQEGMPGSIMEAMASALPVVGTDVNGTRDLVVDHETGRLVPVGNPEALADRLEELLCDPARRREMGTAGRRRILDEFSLDAMIDATCAVHRAVSAGRGRER